PRRPDDPRFLVAYDRARPSTRKSRARARRVRFARAPDRTISEKARDPRRDRLGLSPRLRRRPRALAALTPGLRLRRRVHGLPRVSRIRSVDSRARESSLP